MRRRPHSCVADRFAVPQCCSGAASTGGPGKSAAPPASFQQLALDVKRRSSVGWELAGAAAWRHPFKPVHRARKGASSGPFQRIPGPPSRRKYPWRTGPGRFSPRPAFRKCPAEPVLLVTASEDPPCLSLQGQMDSSALKAKGVCCACGCLSRTLEDCKCSGEMHSAAKADLHCRCGQAELLCSVSGTGTGTLCAAAGEGHQHSQRTVSRWPEARDAGFAFEESTWQ